MNSRELVYRTIRFENKTERVPRDLWSLPWVSMNCPDNLEEVLRRYPADMGSPDIIMREKSPVAKGNTFQFGSSTDDWGCRFENINPGLLGEVKQPIVVKEDWRDADNVHIPVEWLSFDADAVNRSCAKKNLFMRAGAAPTPFERLQFIRGTEELYMDLLNPPPAMEQFISRMHDFHCTLLEAWARTDVDMLSVFDDWGSQRSLLINPALWRKLFKPLYRDYINIAKAHNKAFFMHSDGYILDILPDLVEIGVDAVNSQIFCMDMADIAAYAGQITFWGEIDRQHLLPHGATEDIDRAVKLIYDTLWRDGGCIAQLEYGAGARFENVLEAYSAWDRMR